MSTMVRSLLHTNPLQLLNFLSRRSNDRGPVSRVWNWVIEINEPPIPFFIIFDDVVEYLSIRCTRLKKQGRRTKLILTVGQNVTTQHLHSVPTLTFSPNTYIQYINLQKHHHHMVKGSLLIQEVHLHACTHHIHIYTKKHLIYVG